VPVLINGPSKKAAAARENGKLGGRPCVEIDLVKVKALAAMMATDAEIATVLDVSPCTIKRAKKREGFQEAMNQGRVHAKLSLRRALWQTALSGNVTMMIFLSKAYLGLRDDGGASADDPISEIRITVRRPKVVQ
jgi:hypothetical protein